MERVRGVAVVLVGRGLLEITQKGQVSPLLTLLVASKS